VALEQAQPPPYQILLLGLERTRAALYKRIDQRVEQMIELGLVEETQHLLAAGYGPPLPAMTSLGYREITAYLAGELTLDAAVAKIKTETHRYVRYQLTAFRKLAGIHWFNLDLPCEEAIFATVTTFLSANPPAGS
jgi:tRNA dimethylallyltransferase